MSTFEYYCGQNVQACMAVTKCLWPKRLSTENIVIGTEHIENTVQDHCFKAVDDWMLEGHHGWHLINSNYFQHAEIKL